MADVFISYSRRDADVAFRIGRLFEQEGWSTWIDLTIALGDDFRPEIDREIDAAACVVVIWTHASVTSAWVRHEVIRALEQHKLVEVELAPGLASQVDLSTSRVERRPAVVVESRIHVDSHREAFLAQIASLGLARPRDQWNASLLVRNWNGQAPSHPIIGWEWTDLGEGTRRICRRERWVEGPIAEYRTTIGNYWQFGYEKARVALGYLTIVKPQHDVTLPKRDKRRERRANEFVLPFTEGGTAGELVVGFNYPSGGVALDPEQVDVIRSIETRCRTFLSGVSEAGFYVSFASNNTGDPFTFDLGVELFAHPSVWCRMVARKRTRDRRKLDRDIAKLRELGWNPPAEGPSEGGRLLGRKLTAWWYDAGPVSDVDCTALAALILTTFLAVYGAPPAGSSLGAAVPRIPHPSE